MELYYYYFFNSELGPKLSGQEKVHISPVFTRFEDREGPQFALGLQRSWLNVMEAYPHIWRHTRLGADAHIGVSRRDRGSTCFIMNLSTASEEDLHPLPPGAWLGIVSPNGKRHRVLILMRFFSTSPPGL